MADPNLALFQKALAAKKPGDLMIVRFVSPLSYEDAVKQGVSGVDTWMMQSPEFGLTVAQLAVGVRADGSAEPPKPPPLSVKYRTIDRLNVRVEPSTSAAKITILAKGAEVWIGETRDGWGRISQGEYVGRWLSMEYLAPL